MKCAWHGETNPEAYSTEPVNSGAHVDSLKSMLLQLHWGSANARRKAKMAQPELDFAQEASQWWSVAALDLNLTYSYTHLRPTAGTQTLEAATRPQLQTSFKNFK